MSFLSRLHAKARRDQYINMIEILVFCLGRGTPIFRKGAYHFWSRASLYGRLGLHMDCHTCCASPSMCQLHEQEMTQIQSFNIQFGQGNYDVR